MDSYVGNILVFVPDSGQHKGGSQLVCRGQNRGSLRKGDFRIHELLSFPTDGPFCD